MRKHPGCPTAPGNLDFNCSIPAPKAQQRRRRKMRVVPSGSELHHPLSGCFPWVKHGKTELNVHLWLFVPADSPNHLFSFSSSAFFFFIYISEALRSFWCLTDCSQCDGDTWGRSSAALLFNSFNPSRNWTDDRSCPRGKTEPGATTSSLKRSRGAAGRSHQGRFLARAGRESRCYQRCLFLPENLQLTWGHIWGL